MAIPQYVTIGWPSTAGTIPSGWSRVTALDGRHPKQIPDSSTNPGTTGGNAQHHHTTDDHTHTISHTHATANLSNSTGTVQVASAGSVDTNPDAHTHATGTISATTGTTEATNHPDSDDKDNDPTRWDVIWIESDGTPTTIPQGAITFWNNATLPPSWTQPANSVGRLPRGAAAAGDGGGTGGGVAHNHAGGSHTHSSDHVHPNATGAASATNTSESAGTLAASDAHTHVCTVTSNNFGTSNAATYETSGNDTPAPPWIKQAIITPPTGGDSLKEGLIALWLQSLASIPTGWVLCDGTNGTPNLSQGLYVMGAADPPADLLGTGGTTTHTHTAGTAHTHTWSSSAHTHVMTIAASAAARGLTGSTSTKAAVNHAHADTNTGAANALTVGTASPNPSMLAAAHDPLHVTVAFIQYKGSTISVSLTADPNAAYGERLGLGLEYRGDTMPLADVTPTVERRRIGWLDSVTIDKQAVSQTDITRNIAADPMPAYGEQVGLGIGLLGEAMPSYVDSLSGEWTYPGWIDSVTALREDVGLVAISKDLGTDNLAAYGERLGLGLEYRGDTMALADVQPALYGDHLATFSDSWGNLGDTTPIIDKQIISTTPITRDITADPWANLADATPIFTKIGILKSTPAADPWENLGDSTPTISKLDIPITRNITADPWANLADQTPLIDKRGILTANLAADPMIFGDETPVIDLKSAAITKNIAADPWGTLADVQPSITGDHLLTFSEPWLNLVDQTPTVDKQTVATTPITRNIAADPWGNLGDTTPTYSEFGYLTAQSPADANIAYAERLGLGIGLLGDGMALADSTPIVDVKVSALTVSISDNLNSWADNCDASTTGLVPKNFNLPADDLANYAEQFGLGEGMRDPWANLADATPDVFKLGILKSTPAADAWGNLADQTPTVAKTTLKTAAPTADPMPAYGERLGTGRGFTDALANYGERLGLGLGMRDDLANYGEEIQVTTGGNYRYTLTDTTLQNWADTPPTVQKIGNLTATPPADAMSMADTTPTVNLLGLITAEFTDDLVNYADSSERIEGLSVGLSDDLANYLEEIRIRGIIPAEIIRLSGKLNSGLAFSGKVVDRIGLSGTVKNNKINVSGKLYEGG